MPQSADPKQVGEMAKALIEFNSHHLQWECPSKIFLIDWQFDRFVCDGGRCHIPKKSVVLLNTWMPLKIKHAAEAQL